MVFDRLLLAAMVAGLIAGILYTSVQHIRVIPIIQIAETYENNPGGVAQSASHHDHASQGHASDHEHVHDSGGWAPADGIERTVFTLLANTLTAIGLAMVLVPLMAWTHNQSGLSNLSWWNGLLWGIAGYGAFFVAPSIGLPPELPGSAAAPLEDRQLWWILTVALTAIALLLVAFLKSPWRWAALLLIIVPHVVGAPHLDPGDPLFPTQEPAAAAELMKLATEFIGATAIANAVLWIVLGLLSVWSIHRFVAPVDTRTLVEKTQS